MQLIPDEELEQLASDRGPDSLEALTLGDLRRQRAQDKQVFAFRVGEYFVVGPMPDAETELHMRLIGEVAKKLKAARGE
jgi:hypothetical protein